MIRIFFLTCLSFLFVTLYGQSPPIKNIPSYNNEDVVNKIIDSLYTTRKVDTFFVFLFNSKPSQNQTQDESYLTCLFWKKKNNVSAILITDSTISYPVNIGEMPSISKNYKKLGITDAENQLQMKLPFLMPNLCDILIVRVGKKSYLVECGSDCFAFKLDPRKTQERCKLINSFKEVLTKGKMTWSTQ